jgi:hypothetical protein
MAYICEECGTIYDQMTQDGFCPKDGCFGAPLMPHVPGASASRQPSPPPAAATLGATGRIENIGLCVLVCDASYSMNDAAFTDSPAIKLKLVTGAAHRAISELAALSRADTAYIAIVGFGARADLVRDRAGKPFLKSVTQINQEFGTGLGDYLFDYFDSDKGGIGRSATDITAGLRLAREIQDQAIKGDLSRWGLTAQVTVQEHDIFSLAEKSQKQVPNIRVLIYSDGAHNPSQDAPLSNPFASMQPSPLMTAFIGEESADEQHRQGAEQMKSLATLCPAHQQKGYFLINTIGRHAVLRGLFRMASGASGFCPQCLKEGGFLSTESRA